MCQKPQALAMSAMRVVCRSEEPDTFVLPIVIAIWQEAMTKNKREVLINDQFYEDYAQNPRSADRALKRLHDKSLIMYGVCNGKHNNAMLLPTPQVDE